MRQVRVTKESTLPVAERRADMLVIGGLRTFHLELGLTELVNQPEEVAPWSSLAVLAVTLAVNLAAAGVLRRKEDAAINRIIISDCLINTISMFSTTALGPFPWFRMNNDYLCSASLFINTAFFAWNSLVPIGIGVFRYLMVSSTVQRVEV
jgi:hypothetical protein